MGADTCPVPEGEGSLLEASATLLAKTASLEASDRSPGERRPYSDGPKVAKFIVG